MTTASLGATSNPPFATGIDPYVNPPYIGYALRAPTSNDKAIPGSGWQDNSQNPPVVYYTTGNGVWNTGGDVPAKAAGSVTPVPASQFGSVALSSLAQLEAGNAPSGSVVPLANDVYTFVNTYASAGGVPATVAAQGIVYLASNADAVAGVPTHPNEVLIPGNLASVFASPPAIGGTAAAAGNFTNSQITSLGVGTAASWQAANSASITNASKILIASNGTSDVQLVSGINGTGTYLPLAFWNGAAERMRLDTSGNLLVGTTTALAQLTVAAAAGWPHASYAQQQSRSYKKNQHKE